MKHIILAVSAAFLVQIANSQTVSLKDFQLIAGEWKGRLTYLDYTSSKQETIGAMLTAKLGTNTVDFIIGYPGESGKGGKDSYVINKEGTMINGMKLTERTMTDKGLLKIVLEEKGRDGNDQRPATFHHELILGKNEFSITKLVKFDGESEFFQRNQYKFTR